MLVGMGIARMLLTLVFGGAPGQHIPEIALNSLESVLIVIGGMSVWIVVRDWREGRKES
jgi:hypothetical protein